MANNYASSSYQDIDPLPNLSGNLFSMDEDVIEDDIFFSQVLQEAEQVCVDVDENFNASEVANEVIIVQQESDQSLQHHQQGVNCLVADAVQPNLSHQESHDVGVSTSAKNSSVKLIETNKRKRGRKPKVEAQKQAKKQMLRDGGKTTITKQTNSQPQEELCHILYFSQDPKGRMFFTTNQEVAVNTETEKITEIVVQDDKNITTLKRKCRREVLKGKRLEDKIKDLHLKNKITTEPTASSSSSIRSCEYCHLMYQSEEHEKAHNDSLDHLLNVEAENGTQHKMLKSEEAELGAIKLPRSCDECDKTFRKKREFLTHHRRLHSHMQPYHCTRCSDKFYRRCDLLLHLRTHLGLQSFPCQECPRSFNQQGKLDDHMVKAHKFPDARVRRFKCTECDKMFLTKLSVERHLKVHTKELPFLCNVCKRRFSTNFSLQSHKRTHTGELPFKCSTCDYRSATRCGLVRHQRRHTGEKPFRCVFCPYASASSAGVRRHMNQHLSEKPFQCPYCTYRSSNMENVRKHIKKTKKHKGLMVYPCKLCSYATDQAVDFVQHMRQVHGSLDDPQATRMSGMLQLSTDDVHKVTITKASPQQVQNEDDDEEEEEGEYYVEADGCEVIVHGREVNDDEEDSGEQQAHTIDVGLWNAIMSIPNFQEIILSQQPVTLIVADHANASPTSGDHDGDVIAHQCDVIQEEEEEECEAVEEQV